MNAAVAKLLFRVEQMPVTRRVYRLLEGSARPSVSAFGSPVRLEESKVMRTGTSSRSMRALPFSSTASSQSFALLASPAATSSVNSTSGCRRVPSPAITPRSGVSLKRSAVVMSMP